MVKTAKLRKKGTMQTAANVTQQLLFRKSFSLIRIFFKQEGKEFLKRAWGEEKYEKVQKIIGAENDSESSEEKLESKSEESFAEPATETESEAEEEKEDESEEPPKKKTRLAKHTTMVNTAKVVQIFKNVFYFVK